MSLFGKRLAALAVPRDSGRLGKRRAVSVGLSGSAAGLVTSIN